MINILITIGIILMVLFFILGVIGTLITKKRYGHSWIGQGYGRK